jgi:hypothetical protein
MVPPECTHRSSRSAASRKILKPFLIAAIVIAAAGCKREADPGDGFDFWLGHWTVEITSRETGKAPVTRRQEMVGRWREKGKSVETISELTGPDGQVLLLKRMLVTFDAERSCYVDTIELSNGAQIIDHATWDEANGAFVMQRVSPEMPKGSQGSFTATRVDKDTFTLTSERKSFGITVGSATGKKNRIGTPDNARYNALEKKFEARRARSRGRQKG